MEVLGINKALEGEQTEQDRQEILPANGRNQTSKGDENYI